MKKLLLLLLLASCSFPTIWDINEWSGCWEVHFGNSWTTGRIVARDDLFRILGWSFPNPVYNDNEVRVYSDTTISDIRQQRTMELRCLGDSIHGIYIHQIDGEVCHTIDTTEIWAKRVPCPDNGLPPF